MSGSFDMIFQRSLVKIVLSDVRFAMNYCVSNLKADYFEGSSLRMIYGAGIQHIMSYESEVTLNTLIRVLNDHCMHQGHSAETFRSLKDEARQIYETHIPNEQYIVDSFVKFCQVNSTKIALQEAINILQTDGDPQEILKIMERAVNLSYNASDAGCTAKDFVDFHLRYRQAYDPARLIPTGFPGFDEALMGGMGRGELHVIQAPPKMGKTTMACNIGANCLLSGRIVYHITLEIEALDVMAKYATRVTGLSYKDLMFVSDEEYARKIAPFTTEHIRFFCNKWAKGTVSASVIKSWIARKRAETGHSPDLIIIDYDDCLVPSCGSKNDLYSDSGQIYTDLLGMAAYFNAAVLTLAQPQRPAWRFPDEGKLIQAEDLAHSARKAHDAYSISSLNFADNQPHGTWFLDMTRRGESSKKIPLVRDLSKSLIIEKQVGF